MQRGQPVTPQDLYARHGANNNNSGELDGCEKLSASTFIELLGLVNASPGVARPTFDSTIVTEFYRESQDTVVDIATSNYRADILGEMRDGRLFDTEAKELLSRYGPRIWGNDRSHLMDARKAPTELYPTDLYYDRPEDYRKIVFWVRCWMAKRALRKASEAGKKGSSNNLNTNPASTAFTSTIDATAPGPTAAGAPVLGSPGTPKKRKRNSNSNSNSTTAAPPARKNFQATDSAPMQSLDPPKRKRGRPRRVDYHQVNYGESSASDEQEPQVDKGIIQNQRKKEVDDNAGAGAEQSSSAWEDHDDQESPKSHQSDDQKENHEKRGDQDTHTNETDDQVQHTESTWREPSPVPDHLTPTAQRPASKRNHPHPNHQRHSSNPQHPTYRRDVPTMEEDEDRSRSSSLATRATKVVRLPVAKAKLTVFEAWEGWKEMAKRQPDGSSMIKELDPSHANIPHTHKSVPSTPAFSHDHIESNPSLGRYDSTQPHLRYQDEAKTEQYDAGLKLSNQAAYNVSSTPSLPPLGFRAINHTLPPSASSSPNPSHPNTLAPIRPTTEQALPIHPHSLPPLQHTPLPLQSQSNLHSPTPKPHPVTTAPPPEDIFHLRRQVLTTLLTLLSSSTSSELVLTTLHPLLTTLRPHISLTTAMPPSRLATLTTTFATWSSMHSALSDFRRISGYAGRAGEEWQAHRRSLAFKDRVVVMEAENRLGTWRLDKRRDGRWVDEAEPEDGGVGRGLDRELAELFELVLGGVGGVGREDLLDGLGEYNDELLSWFR